MIFAVDHPLCDVWNQKKTQILIEFLDGKKKVQLVSKKSFLWFRAFRTYFWEVDHPLCNVIGVQVFEKAKIYKPTWTQNHPSAALEIFFNDGGIWLKGWLKASSSG